ncbi:MAG: FHA domain-containing protein [Phycisphaeraceae bacterium]|nr:MAG: FHA domain-containing protein [Phycisphaeraceae bacterium]
MVLTLTIIEGPDAGNAFQVPANEPQLIGRSSEALPITDTTVSRRHAELTPDAGTWFIRDLQSQNHTHVNGVQIDERTRVRDGDLIRVGATVFLVGEAETRRINTVEIVDEDRLDSEVEHRLPSNEDSVILAEPEPSRAAVDHLRVIYQLTALTSQLLDRADLLNEVMELVFNEFEPERGVIMLLDKPRTKEQLQESGDIPPEGDIPLVGIDMEPAVVKYATLPPDDDDEATIHVSKTILTHCVREGEGILSSNAQADPRFQAGDSIARYNIRSAICSPITFGDRTFGAMYIDSSIANYTFTREQLALLNAIGAHTALALANAEQTARRLHTERLAAIGETVASLSHSIKNILQGLRGGADVVEMGLKKGDLKVSTGGWEILRRNLDRIVTLTMNMLAFSRPKHVELELTNVGPLMRECADLLADYCEENKIALVVDADPEMPPVPLDQNLMHQALMNLLTNAVEAVPPEEGVVSVRIRYHEPDFANPRRKRPVLEISVIDNGPGIPKKKLNWIFEPFHTTKGIKGTGLGLAVTKRIVTDHRGRIHVESVEGKGAAFRVLIPADLDQHADPSATDGGPGTAMLRGL